MKASYFDERNLKCRKQLAKQIEDLPSYCFDFFLSIENNSSPLTRVNYASDLSIFFDYLSKYVFGIDKCNITLVQINSLSARQLETFLNYVSFYEINNKMKKNSENGKMRKLATLRSFFKFLYNKDYISANITDKIQTPKKHLKPITRLEPDEVVKLLNTAEQQTSLTKKQQSYKNLLSLRDCAILTLLLGTGIRVSECVGLDITDIDLEHNAFSITRKGGNQVVLYFSDEVKSALIRWLDKRSIILGEVADSNVALFISLQKKRMCVKSVENMVKKYSQIASPLKKISPHKLRSTFGTNLYRETQDIYVVAEVLGHKDVNTTKKHYAALGDDIRRQVIEKIKLR